MAHCAKVLKEVGRGDKHLFVHSEGLERPLSVVQPRKRGTRSEGDPCGSHSSLLKLLLLLLAEASSTCWSGKLPKYHGSLITNGCIGVHRDGRRRKLNKLFVRAPTDSVSKMSWVGKRAFVRPSRDPVQDRAAKNLGRGDDWEVLAPGEDDELSAHADAVFGSFWSFITTVKLRSRRSWWRRCGSWRRWGRGRYC